MRLKWLFMFVFLAAMPSRAIADNAEEAKRHFTRAKEFHAQGDYGKALKELKAAYTAEPNPSLLYGIAQTYVKLGNCQEAITFYQHFIDSKPTQDAIDHARAASEACKTSPTSEPQGATASPTPASPTMSAKEHFARATAFHKQGDYAGALKELTSANDAEPTSTLMYAIAQTHVKLGHCAEAITFYRRYIDSKPKPEAVERALAAIDSCKSATPTPSPAAKPSIAATETRAVNNKPAETKAVDSKPVDSKPVANTSINTKPIDTKLVESKHLRVRPVIPRPPETSQNMVHLDMEDHYDRHPVRKWAYAGAGLGVGAMLVATAFGAAADGAQKSFSDAGCGDRNQVLRADALAKCVEYEGRGARDVRIGNGLLIGGGSVLALFAALIILDPGNVERPTIERSKLGGVSVGVSPTSVSLSMPW